VDMRGMLLSRMKKIIKNTSDDLILQITRARGAEAAASSSFIAGGFFNVYIEWHKNPDSMTLEEAASIASRMVEICVRGINSAT
ncbi:MAG: hypothetical protein ACI4Q4_03390, partial [Oscillospiraceae bacterium]